MKRLVLLALAAAGGYAAGAVLGYAGISVLSGNTHDRALEAAMTAAFVTGPAAAVVAVVIALAAGRRRPSEPRT
ncbi:MAG TPA: hypothetical protein VIL35_00500 [Vicinamibacterales bacterium]